MEARHMSLTLLAAVAAIGLTACSIDVHDEDPGRQAVDITTPVGDLSVRTDEKAPDVGLPVYPGARPSRGRHDRPENADVSIAGPAFGLKVLAASYESDDPQDRVVDFYRKAMRSFGEVTECRGDVDFTGKGSERRPVCTEKWFSRAPAREVQLLVGVEDSHRMVVVKPRSSGSEIALVYVRTHEES